MPDGLVRGFDGFRDFIGDRFRTGTAWRSRGCRQPGPCRQKRCEGPSGLDGREVGTISAILFHDGGRDDPARLGANAGKSFRGDIVLGMGFTFDDADLKCVG